MADEAEELEEVKREVDGSSPEVTECPYDGFDITRAGRALSMSVPNDATGAVSTGLPLVEE